MNKDIQQVGKLYQAGFSAREISEKMKLPLKRIYRYVHQLHIPIRTRHEANQLVYSRKPASFLVKKRLTKNEECLRVAGVMLYWGEGSQWAGEKNVDFANSNPLMISLFMSFLRQVCSIDETKLRAYLYCYQGQDPQKLIVYWSQRTGIPRNQFTAPYVKAAGSKGKEGKMPYGLLHVRYYDKKLLQQIREWISSLAEQLT